MSVWIDQITVHCDTCDFEEKVSVNETVDRTVEMMDQVRETLSCRMIPLWLIEGNSVTCPTCDMKNMEEGV